MNIENLAENAQDFTGNVWLMSSADRNVLIDTGTGDSWKYIEELERVDKVVITHSHYDHVDNIEKIVERFDPEIYAFKPENLQVAARKVGEGDSLELGETKFEVFHTPGHKDDSICLYSSERKMLFTGDLLFPNGGFGRTDLEEGDRDVLINSIKKIVDLDVEKMYCGHEPAALENVNDQIQSSLEKALRHEPKY